MLAKKLGINSTIKLIDGNEIPALGFGTWKLRNGREAGQAVAWALEAGYRHVDTASAYGNEESVGKAIRESGIEREKIFVATKLYNTEHANPRKALESSLKRLGADYADLYLIHFPVAGKRLRTWKAFEKFREEGACKSIGVSNFTVRHLQQLLEQTEIVPAVNQVEFSPYLFQKDLLEFCNSKKIVVEAYSPLTRGERLGDGKLVEIANKYGKTSAQILLRWALQHGMVVLPKSANKERISENAGIFSFEIGAQEMKKLDGFGENLRLCWDPTGVP